MRTVPCFGRLWNSDLFTSYGWRGKFLVFVSVIWSWIGKKLEAFSEKLVTTDPKAQEFVETSFKLWISSNQSKEKFFSFSDPGISTPVQTDLAARSEKYQEGRINHMRPRPLAKSNQASNEEYSQFLAQHLSPPRSQRYAQGRRNFLLVEDFETQANTESQMKGHTNEQS